MLVAATVMAHPDRRDRAEALATVLQKEFPTRIVYDPDPNGPASTIPTARLAWEPWKSGQTHHLLLQDDVQPVPFFAQSIREIVAVHQDRWVSLATEWGSKTSWVCRAALLANSSYAKVADGYVPTWGLVVPTEQAENLSAYLNDVDDMMDDDHALYDFAQQHVDLPPIVTIPNLIEHGATISLLGNDRVLGTRKSTMTTIVEPPSDWWQRGEFLEIRELPLVLHHEPGPPVKLSDPGTYGYDYSSLSYSEAEFVRVQSQLLSSSIALSTSARSPFALLCLCLEHLSRFAAHHRQVSDFAYSDYVSGLRNDAISGSILGALRRVLNESDVRQLNNLTEFAGMYFRVLS